MDSRPAIPTAAGDKVTDLLLSLFASSLVSTLGDIACKYASKETGARMVWFIVGASVCWGLLPLIWVHIYRSRSMLEMVLMYNPFHMAMLGLVGIVLFGDEVTGKLVLGGVLSALAIWVMA